ncbi:MAG: methylated-DNA--[protein]-cysteine S-methyltransferase [Rhodobacteraceae bacterium]|nr:methylated-DNA--[protein]-cysteine S-methyltransferase [Paracoccaceae bacterium]
MIELPFDTAPGPPLNGPADLAALLRPEGRLRAAWFYTPVGGMVGVIDATCVHLLEFASRDRVLPAFARLGPIAPAPQGVGLAQALQDQLTAYFAGRRDSFSLPLALPRTAFAAQVRAALLAIPFGRTQSYGAVAAALGVPRAARAVGRANGANPLAILVPCHRLLGPKGQLTGYAGGLWRKEWLLAHEGRGLVRTD